MSSYVSVLAFMGLAFDDLYSIISVIGSLVILLGSFLPLRRFSDFARWSILGLLAGVVGQVSIVLSGEPAEKVGILTQTPFAIVNGLLGLSFLFLCLSWWLRRNKYRFQ